MDSTNRKKKIKSVFLCCKTTQATSQYPNLLSFESAQRQLRESGAAIGSEGEKACPF